MPELPEVQTVVNTLRPRVRGKRIISAELLRPDILDPSDSDLPKALAGRVVKEIERRAKRIVFTLDDADRFYIHLGMSGSLTISASGTPRKKHTHLILHFERFEVRFIDPRRFGGVWWRGCETCEEGLGPEPLSIRAGELFARLQNTTRAIKNALLDQTLIAGLGNIYVDESLFDASLHPLLPADRLTREQVTRLTQSIKRVLNRALKHRGSTLRNYQDANGDAGGFQRLFRVYDRGGKPCVHCGTTLKRITVGGRTTTFCPHCQPRRAARVKK